MKSREKLIEPGIAVVLRGSGFSGNKERALGGLSGAVLDNTHHHIGQGLDVAATEDARSRFAFVFIEDFSLGGF